jgi:hypothetical protein
MSYTISPRNLLSNLSTLTVTHARASANTGEVSDLGKVQRGQVLTRDGRQREKHCPTRQSSRRLAAAADFVVMSRSREVTMSAITTIADPKILFDRWFVKAIAQLEKLENGDGGTAGMMVVLPLYERYIYILKTRDKSKRKFYEIMAADLNLSTPSEAETFWTIFRHGFCHTAMPFERNKAGKALPKVSFTADYSSRPEFHTASDGQRVVCLDPWKFIHYVMDKYRNDPTLLMYHPDAPLLAIHVLA